MYVEVSPRQSGKTTRLVVAASTFLRENQDSNIAIVSHNRRNSEEVKKLILTRLELEISWTQGMDWPDDLVSRAVYNEYRDKIKVKSNTALSRGEMPPDYWFFDEFAYIPLPDIFPGPAVHNDYNQGNRVPSPSYGNMIVTNGYYCTTPKDRYNPTTDTLISWCQTNNQTVNFHNPWTEQRLMEQETLSPYIREHVLNHWVEYMTGHGFPIAVMKENWFIKHIKKHNFVSGS